MPDDVSQAVRERFDGRAPTYDDSLMHRGLARAVVDSLDLDGVVDVLDVATGTGLVLRALQERLGECAALRMVGVDLSPGMLAVARTALPDARLLEADAAALPLADASVDLVTCVTALHLIPGTAGVVAEWVRVLRPGGRVVTATYADFDPGRHHREAATPAAVPYPMRHGPFATPEALQEQVAPAGLRVLRHSHWSDGHERLLLAELG